MTNYNSNNYIIGGNVYFNGGINNVGGPSVYHAPVTGEQRTSRLADVGVLTVLAEETRAVREALRRMSGFREYQLANGPLAAEASLSDRSGKQVRVAAVNALTPGGRSIAVASHVLLERYRPAVLLMVGVAAGISDGVRLGDVVLSDQVLTYDERLEHRAEVAFQAPALLRYRINAFLAQASSPGTYQIHSGSVLAMTGRGDAPAIQLPRTGNAECLAVEAEAGVVADVLRPAMRDNADLRGWLSIRGIADHAVIEKGLGEDSRLAAEHAAEVMSLLLPFLSFDEQ